VVTRRSHSNALQARESTAARGLLKVGTMMKPTRKPNRPVHSLTPADLAKVIGGAISTSPSGPPLPSGGFESGHGA
jgi:hypothetical protein